MFRYKLGTSSTNSYWIIDIQYNSTGSDTVTRQQIDNSRTGKYSLLQASMLIGTATNTTAYSTYRSDNIYAEPSTGIIYATEFSGNVAWNNITDKPTIPSSFTITANATDGLWDLTGTSGTNAVTYALAPYNSKGNTATFYTAATNPTLTTRLNYDGYFQWKKIFLPSLG